MINKPLNLMIQGTTSSAGKSFLVTALCRIFKQDGYRVAPFKSQNMALNSFITKENREMGRAQVVQAESAGIEPSTFMNPILLKPNSDTGSQVIVKGKIWKNLSAREYYQVKEGLIPVIKEAYSNLSQDYNIIIIEGAGSPAEINLKANDIVNMGIAEMFEAPVILVADIDRGGVFASIYGTVMLLKPNERKRVKGFIINKFRGDVKILIPGINEIEERLNLPCLGVIPYKKFYIDEEDSLIEKESDNSKHSNFNIGIVNLDHISNQSDFTIFNNYPDIKVTYLNELKDYLLNFDLLIIPGSKNTISDLNSLRNRNLIEPLKLLIKKTFTIGICGGFQILGNRISDPNHLESNLSSIEGLKLLDFETVIQEKKEIRQIVGKTEFNENIKGYMIHMGQNFSNRKYKPFCYINNEKEGIKTENLIGTYIHGIFDNDSFRFNLLNKLGYSGKSNSFKEFKEKNYNNLANFIRENINLKKIYQITGLNND